ncbi:hypothetical protein ACIGXG_36245 [Streptomyces goshikiensis]|uniref:hypothetical protein n=1 Tax=Streptomyces goshikiensis TaxID=1942 RepID=UPI0037CDA25D
MVVDVRQELLVLGSLGGQKPRCRNRKYGFGFGAGPGPEDAAGSAHHGSLPRGPWFPDRGTAFVHPPGLIMLLAVLGQQHPATTSGCRRRGNWYQ